MGPENLWSLQNLRSIHVKLLKEDRSFRLNMIGQETSVRITETIPIIPTMPTAKPQIATWSIDGAINPTMQKSKTCNQN